MRSCWEFQPWQKPKPAREDGKILVGDAALKHLQGRNWIQELVAVGVALQGPEFEPFPKNFTFDFNCERS